MIACHLMWVLCHFTGFARLLWGRVKWSRSFLIQSDLCIAHLYYLLVYTQRLRVRMRLIHMSRVSLYVGTYGNIPSWLNEYSFDRLHVHMQKGDMTLERTEWHKCVGCLELQISFRKRNTNYRALLRKITYKDQAFYGSLPNCRHITSILPWVLHVRLG